MILTLELLLGVHWKLNTANYLDDDTDEYLDVLNESVGFGLNE